MCQIQALPKDYYRVYCKFVAHLTTNGILGRHFSTNENNDLHSFSKVFKHVYLYTCEFRNIVLNTMLVYAV